jgi:hypothetical protein
MVPFGKKNTIFAQGDATDRHQQKNSCKPLFGLERIPTVGSKEPYPHRKKKAFRAASRAREAARSGSCKAADSSWSSRPLIRT